MENYEINKETLAIIPIEEELSRVVEEKKEYIVRTSVLKIIDDSCKFFGSSYEGRFEGTKTINIMGVSKCGAMSFYIPRFLKYDESFRKLNIFF